MIFLAAEEVQIGRMFSGQAALGALFEMPRFSAEDAYAVYALDTSSTLNRMIVNSFDGLPEDC